MQKNESTATGFEPVRANPTDCELIRVCRLNPFANISISFDHQMYQWILTLGQTVF